MVRTTDLTKIPDVENTDFSMTISRRIFDDWNNKQITDLRYEPFLHDENRVGYCVKGWSKNEFCVFIIFDNGRILFSSQWYISIPEHCINQIKDSSEYKDITSDWGEEFTASFQDAYDDADKLWKPFFAIETKIDGYKNGCNTDDIMQTLLLMQIYAPYEIELLMRIIV